ncbi:YncE family protein [uncultured Clostridium sp.]|uniref:YncE family protein n=1 Tax=uncultured Clostridium sp. TaxID=59620 RepID=UPI0025CF82C1|nr:YncE family protein [uncultured Clostridium sp.]MDU4882185.1 YncE family protein [Clostridium celatum]MDU7075455.1 YncE family protein [Clostridium celatum]
MSSIVLCNTGADSLSKIDLDTFEVKKILFKLSERPVGPHGIRKYGNEIITANSYSDSISIFSGLNFEEIKNIKIGPKPNDLVKVGNKIYTICGEANSIVAYDLNQNRVLWELNIGNWPHSIDYYYEKELLFVSNLEENCTKIINLEDYQIVKTLLTPEYPTKVKISNDKKYIYICESYLGSDDNGYLDVFSIETFNRVTRIEVGTSPIDMYEDNKYIYVSNFTEGSISVIDKNLFKSVKTLYIGGMPKGILKKDNKIYIGDYLKGRLIVVEEEKIKKIIAIESEPNAMILF